MFIEDTTPIAALTVADFKKLLKDSLREQKIEAIPPSCSVSFHSGAEQAEQLNN